MPGPARISTRHDELCASTPLRPIKNEVQHQAALTMIDEILFEKDWAELPEDEADYLEVLTNIVWEYEKQIYPEPDISPVDMLRGLVESSGKRKAELARNFGISDSTLSQLVSGRRKIGITDARRFAKYFKVGIECFLKV